MFYNQQKCSVMQYEEELEIRRYYRNNNALKDLNINL